MVETDPHTNGPSGDIPIERLNLNQHDKPPPRRPHIEKLPTEILENIFEHVGAIDEWGHGPDRKDRIRDIKNCCLTCSIFNETSSRFLCQTVQVSCDRKSLRRLGNISQHKTIRKGVQRVVVRLARYDRWFTTDYEGFLNGFRDMLNAYWYRGFGDVHEKHSRSVATWASWTEDNSMKTLASPRDKEAYEDARPEGETHRTLLEEAWQEYKRRYEEQEALTRDGTFFEDIALALTRMPGARKILFTAHPPGGLRLFQRLTEPSQDVSDALYEYLLHYCRFRREENWSFVIPQVIAAIGQAKVKLKLINVMMDYSAITGLENDQEKIRNGVSLAVEQLDEFSFHCREVDIGSNLRMLEINRFLTCCLDSSKLQFFALHIVPDKRKDRQAPGELWSGEHNEDRHALLERCSLARAIRSRVWPELRRVHIGKTWLHLEDLEGFVRDLPRGPQQPRVILDSIRLLSGTWAEALMILREESSACVSFAGTGGGGLDEWKGRAVFRSKNAKAETDDRSLAARYVNEREKDLRNPLYEY